MIFCQKTRAEVLPFGNNGHLRAIAESIEQNALVYRKTRGSRPKSGGQSAEQHALMSDDCLSRSCSKGPSSSHHEFSASANRLAQRRALSGSEASGAFGAALKIGLIAREGEGARPFPKSTKRLEWIARGKGNLGGMFTGIRGNLPAVIAKFPKPRLGRRLSA
jgi:hypothetical protein